MPEEHLGSYKSIILSSKRMNNTELNLFIHKIVIKPGTFGKLCAIDPLSKI